MAAHTPASRPRKPPLLVEPRRVVRPRQRRAQRRPARAAHRRCGWPPAACPTAAARWAGRHGIVPLDGLRPARRQVPTSPSAASSPRSQAITGVVLVAEAAGCRSPRARRRADQHTYRAARLGQLLGRRAAGPSTRASKPIRCSSSNGSPCHWMIRGTAAAAPAPRRRRRGDAAGVRRSGPPRAPPARSDPAWHGPHAGPPCIGNLVDPQFGHARSAGRQDHQVRDVGLALVDRRPRCGPRDARLSASSLRQVGRASSCCQSPPPRRRARAHQQPPRLRRFAGRSTAAARPSPRAAARADCTRPTPSSRSSSMHRRRRQGVAELRRFARRDRQRHVLAPRQIGRRRVDRLRNQSHAGRRCSSRSTGAAPSMSSSSTGAGAIGREPASRRNANAAQACRTPATIDRRSAHCECTATDSCVRPTGGELE